MHSRINNTIQHICQNVHCGNLYINRNMVGAVVGVQPFGGEGLSGTGPKAGGPHYLLRFVTERTTTVNGQTVKLPATGDDFATWTRFRGRSPRPRRSRHSGCWPERTSGRTT